MRNKKNQNRKKFNGNLLYFVLGLFFPTVALTLYFVWKDEKKGDSKLSLIGAIIGFILKIVVCTICIPYLLNLSNRKYECLVSGGHWTYDNRCYYDSLGYYEESEQVTLLECKGTRTGDLRVKKGDTVVCLVEFPITSGSIVEHEFDLSYGSGLRLNDSKITPDKEHSGTHFNLLDTESATIEFEVLDDSNEDELVIALVNYVHDEFDSEADVEYITEEFLEVEE